MTTEHMPEVAESKRPPLSARKKAFSVHPNSRAKFVTWSGELLLYKHGLKREPVLFGPALILSVGCDNTVVFEWHTRTGMFREFTTRGGDSRRVMRQLINAGYEGYMRGEAYLFELIQAFTTTTERMGYVRLYERFMPHITLNEDGYAPRKTHATPKRKRPTLTSVQAQLDKQGAAIRQIQKQLGVAA